MSVFVVQLRGTTTAEVAEAGNTWRKESGTKYTWMKENMFRNWQTLLSFVGKLPRRTVFELKAKK